MTDLTLEQLAQKVRELREAQKDYFKNQSSYALTKRKTLEKQLDDLVKNIPLPQIPTQSNLF